MSDDSVLTEIDDLIAKITQSIDRLEDSIDWSEHDADFEYDYNRAESVYHPRSRGASITGLSSSVFNCFPSNRMVSCCDTFFLILPRNPSPRNCGPCEAEPVMLRYFHDAMYALYSWAQECKGSTLVILTDTWPLPPGGQKLTLPDFWSWDRSKYGRSLTKYGIMHTKIGRLVKQNKLKCHITLFTGLGGVTKLPVMSGGNWPIGW